MSDAALSAAQTSDWRDTTIGNEVTLQRGFDITRATQTPGAVPVVSSGGISSTHNAAMVKGPGVVLGRKGVVGSVYYIDSEYWPHDTTLWVKDFKGNLPRFVYYFFRGMVDRLARMDVGSANPTLNRNHVHPIEVSWPALRQQHAIAGVLGALDDKIEHNRRTARALARLARAIFQAWFVDFEPVKAKAAGATAFPSMPQSVFDALPTRFVNSEFGAMPEGWQHSTIGESANHIAMGPFGSDIKTDNFVAEGVPVIRGGNLTDGFVDEDFVYLTEAKADQLSNANAFPGDLVITHRGTLGQVGLIPSRSRHRRYVVSQSQMLIRPDAEHLPRHFLYLFLTSPAGQHELLANRSQTGVPAISRPTTSVKAIRVVVPAQSVLLHHFESIASTLFDGMAVIGAETRKLAEMRDYLLPKLLSGNVQAQSVLTEKGLGSD